MPRQTTLFTVMLSGKMPPPLGPCRARPWRLEQSSRHAFKRPPVPPKMAAPITGCGDGLAVSQQGTCRPLCLTLNTHCQLWLSMEHVGVLSVRMHTVYSQSISGGYIDLPRWMVCYDAREPAPASCFLKGTKQRDSKAIELLAFHPDGLQRELWLTTTLCLLQSTGTGKACL